jgi:hypothetical protein
MKKYICDSCGEEFTEYELYATHERKCTKRHHNFKMNVYNALSKFLSLHSKDNIILYSDFRIDEDTDGYDPGCQYGTYKLEIVLGFTDGSTLSITDGEDILSLGVYQETEDILSVLEKKFNDRKTTTYEGILSWNDEDGWRTETIGEFLLSDIVDKLKGRRVRIEVI